MKALFQDLAKNFSSGLLVKFLAFVFAFELGILALALGAELTATATAVGSLLALVTGFQWIQSATGNGLGGPTLLNPTPMLPSGSTNPPGQRPAGLFEGPDMTPDLARWIKFLAFLAGIVVLHVAVIWLRPRLMDACAVAGAFFVLCTSQELATKATGT